MNLSNLRDLALASFLALSLVACGSNSAAPSSGDAGVDGARAGGEGGSPAPVTGLKPNEWVWAPVAVTHCRDGSDTGFAVNLASRPSDKLVIYLETGGACMDQFFCSAIATPSTFGASEFASWKAGSGTMPSKVDAGLFNRGDPANPVAGWNLVYIPYCTGDIFAGANPKGMVPNVGPQQFVGYTDVHLDVPRNHEGAPDGFQRRGLRRVRELRANHPGLRILHTGLRAGRFRPAHGGAVRGRVRAESARGSLGEGGAIADCGSDCSDPKSCFVDFTKHLAEAYPTMPFGLISSTQDQIMGLFFGYGNPGVWWCGAL